MKMLTEGGRLPPKPAGSESSHSGEFIHSVMSQNSPTRAQTLSKGWLAQLQGNLSGSLTSYQLSLSLWQRRHGEEHASTGWGYILVGNINAEQGQTASALADMQRGLAILDRTLGRQHPRYLTAEIAYSGLLERTEAHAEAAQMKTAAEQDLRKFYRDQCSDCTISAVAFH
jgi:Tetratricopeptide repeat